MSWNVSTTPPFDQPVSVIVARLRLERPWVLSPTTSCTPTTTLRGLLGAELTSNERFRDLERWFKKPPSDHYANQLVPRLVVRATTTSEPAALRVGVLLRGPTSDAIVERVMEALTEAGRRGVLQRGAATSFVVDEQEVAIGESMAHLARYMLGDRGTPSSLRLEFVTPCDAKSLEPIDLVGNLACGLVKLSSAWVATMPREIFDARVDAARAAAREAFGRVRVTRRSLRDGPRGERASGETGASIPLRGRVGELELTGELAEAIPWLLLAEVHGVGAHVAFGMGQVRLVWP